MRVKPLIQCLPIVLLPRMKRWKEIAQPIFKQITPNAIFPQEEFHGTNARLEPSFAFEATIFFQHIDVENQKKTTEIETNPQKRSDTTQPATTHGLVQIKAHGFMFSFFGRMPAPDQL
jgi:hypothetical protein